MYEVDIERSKAALDQAIRVREEALVRSPIDGVVTQINSRQGESASSVGIVKIVDMKQLRVFATVDELHLPRLTPGAPVQITFRGSPTVYGGRITLAPLTVKREKRSEADFGVASVRQVEVEIEPDDGVTFPQLLGHEARITFL
jgi:multidrug resistance efflux pump